MSALTDTVSAAVLPPQSGRLTVGRYAVGGPRRASAPTPPPARRRRMRVLATFAVLAVTATIAAAAGSTGVAQGASAATLKASPGHSAVTTY